MKGRTLNPPTARDRLAALLRKAPWFAVWLLLLAPSAGATAAETSQGEQIYRTVCIGCHQIGVLGAPKYRDVAAWSARLSKGLDTLVGNALKGVGKMPPKGGNPALTAADLKAAIRFMAGEEALAGAGKAPPPAPAAPAVAAVAAKGAADSARGGEVVSRVCKGCHEVGVLGAPKLGNQADWNPRLAKGEDTLVANALKGVGNMPPKGGAAELTADDLRAAIRFMADPKALELMRTAAKPTKAPAGDEATALQTGVQAPTGVNRFNRLLRPKAERNRPPAKDGIHDPANEGTNVLQPPKQAFTPLPSSTAGNYVDWVQALAENKIQPRWDLADPTKEPLVMDLNIVREVKGSMPNVVYPHKQHLQWLDCSNCHPAIFEPRKGANAISMAEILLGRKCGVCHGKVAFPVSECRRCHSQKKDVAAIKTGSAGAPGKAP